MITASNRQHTLGGDGCGNLAMLRPPGNPDTHPVPSGRHRLTNYDAASIAAALDELQQNNCHAKVMVDCSHANACKQHERQIPIAKEVIAQRTQGNKGILGLMIESNIAAGRQNDGTNLTYGQSITDACISWNETEQLLTELHAML